MYRQDDPGPSMIHRILVTPFSMILSAFTHTFSRLLGTLAFTLSNRDLNSFMVVVIGAAAIGSLSLILGRYSNSDFLYGILVESHGVVLEVFVLVVLVGILTRLGTSRFNPQLSTQLDTREIAAHVAEIDDFRGWESQEAAFRTAGNIKRLNRLGMSDIDLRRVYLADTVLTEASLQGAFLPQADLTSADLTRANLQEAVLAEAKLTGADLQAGVLAAADLTKANLSGANLQEANLTGADLQGAVLEGTNLTGANLREADLRNVRNLTLEQLRVVTTLYEARLDTAIQTVIEEEYPHLLKRPGHE